MSLIVFLLYFFKNIFKFYQLVLINVCKFDKCQNNQKMSTSIYPLYGEDETKI